MLKRMPTVTIVLGLIIALAYWDPTGHISQAETATRPVPRRITGNVGGLKERNIRPDHRGHVAVVDMNKIGNDIGEWGAIDTAAQVRERNLQISQRAMSQRVQAELAALAKETGSKPADGDKRALDEWTAKMRNLERARLDANNRIRQAFLRQQQANQQAMSMDFHRVQESIKPLAVAVAKAKGMDVVVTSSQILGHAGAVDITSDVQKQVNALLKAGNFPRTKIPKPIRIKVTQPTTAPRRTP